MVNKQDYVDLGLSCVDICKALKRGVDGRELNELSKSVREAIDQLETWVERAIHIFCSSAYHHLDLRTVAEIHQEIEERSGRRRISRFFHSRDDKEAIPAWNLKLARILQVFNVCSTRACLVAAKYPFLRPSWL